MPSSIIGAIVASFVAESVFVTSIVGAGIFARVIGGVVGAVVGGVVSGAMSGGQKNQSQGAANPVVAARGRLVTIRQPVAPWQIVYGEVRLGGVLTFVHISSDQQYIHLVITLAGHECQEIGDVYFGDEVVPLDGSGEATGTFAGYARVKKSLGAEAGQPFADLVAESSGLWTDAHRQSGRAKLYVRLKANPDLYQTGVPNITAVVKGRKVYDPRTATTAWSANAALCVNDYLTNATFGLGATYATEIDATQLIAAANACDEEVLLASATATFTADASTDALTLADSSKLPRTGDGVRVASSTTLPAPLAAATTYYAIRGAGGTLKLATTRALALVGTAINLTTAGSGTHTLTYYNEVRYRTDGTFLASAEPQRVLGLLLAAAAGKAVNVGGLWFVFTGAYEAPTITLDEGDLAGPIRVQSLVSRRDNANGVKGIFTDPDSSWQATDFPALASATYLAEDGERVWRDLDLSAFVTSGTQAQRLAKIELLSVRQGLTVDATFKLSAWAAMTGRTVALTNTRFGWSAKAFEVAASRFVIAGDGTLGVGLSLRETAAAVFDWSTSEEQTVDLAPNTSLPDFRTVNSPGVPAISEAVYETRDGRGVAAKAIVTFAQSDYPFGASYQVEYKLASASTYTVLPPVRVATGSTGAVVREILDFTPGRFDFRVLAIGVGGARSGYATSLNKEIIALSARPATPVIRGLQAQGDGISCILTLEPHPELDVRRGGRWRIRHTEGDSPTWETSFSIGDAEGYVGDQTIIALPLKAGSYCVKAEDSTGQQSSGFDYIVVKQASIFAFTLNDTLVEETAFTGTKVDCVAIDSILKLDGAGLIDGIPDMDAISSIDGYGGVEADGTYTFADSFNFGAVTRVRITGEIQGQTVNVNDLIDDRSGMVDDWLDFDGSAGGGSTDAWIEARETDDNPAGAPVWSDWKRLDAAAFEAWGVQCRLRMISSDVAYNQHINVLRAVAEQVV